MSADHIPTGSIQITVNGNKQTVDETTVGALLARLGIPIAGTAVELDGQILPHADLAAKALHGGETLEIVRLVGGG